MPWEVEGLLPCTHHITLFKRVFCPHAFRPRNNPRYQNEMHGTPAPHDYANKDFRSPYL